jgi:hypothetical protein
MQDMANENIQILSLFEEKIVAKEYWASMSQRGSLREQNEYNPVSPSACQVLRMLCTQATNQCQ